MTYLDWCHLTIKGFFVFRVARPAISSNLRGGQQSILGSVGFSYQTMFDFGVDLHEAMVVLLSLRVEFLWLAGLCVRSRVVFLRMLQIMAFGLLALSHGGLALLLHILTLECQG